MAVRADVAGLDVLAHRVSHFLVVLVASTNDHAGSLASPSWATVSRRAEVSFEVRIPKPLLNHPSTTALFHQIVPV